MGYIHCVFKHSPTIGLHMREVGARKQAESKVGETSCSDRSIKSEKQNTRIIKTKCKVVTDQRLTNISRSFRKPIEIKISVTRDSKDNDGNPSFMCPKTICSA